MSVTKATERLWKTGDALEAGRTIFEDLPFHKRPLWAADVLAFASSVIPDVPREVTDAIAVARDPQRWHEGHLAFDRIRRTVLDVDRKGRDDGWPDSQRLLASFLAIGEQTAKVAYNACNPRDEFDEDSGWWIAVLLREVVALRGDLGFERAAWKVLTVTPK